jgi:hypothetical protein
MARVTHVKKAQQRYHTKPVIDPETGEQKKTPVLRRDGSQKVTKKGKPVFMRVTEADKDRPKDPLRCDFSGCQITDGKILPGQAYKHITPKSGPYGGTQKSRHEEHPTWQRWEYNYSLGAQIERIQYDFNEAVSSAESPDDVQSALEEAASEIESLAQEKSDSADNIEEGFGHETSMSEELRQTAEDLEGWAQEIQSADVPELDDHPCEHCSEGQADCVDCDGTGKLSETEGDCETCGGDGTVDCDWCDGEGTDLEAWREAVTSELTIIDESPV